MATDLVQVLDGEIVVLSRKVAETFGKNHKHVLRDIEALKQKDVSKIGPMFHKGTLPDSYGREQKVYFMNRDGFSFLVMGFTGKEATEWKLKYIAAFNEMEKRLQVQNAPLTDDEIMGRALLIANERLAKLTVKNESLKEQVDEMKPKALFADSVSASQNSILVGDLVKLLRQNGVETGQRRLFAYLRNHGYLMKQKGSSWNMPTQESIEKGLFEIRESVQVLPDGSVKTVRTTKVTGKGQVYFVNRFLSDSPQLL